MKSALIIFLRNPVLGQVKTRIAKDLGNEVALQVYQKLLQHTIAIAKDIDADRFVFYADFINNNDLWDNAVFNKRLQSGSDLGERMKNAFAILFEEDYKNIVIIGSDCFDLTTEIIKEAFYALKASQFVIGPATDGGYYLLGMNVLLPEIFLNKRWSTENVYADTVNDIMNAKLSYYQLTMLSDVDNAGDVKRYDALKIM